LLAQVFLLQLLVVVVVVIRAVSVLLAVRVVALRASHQRLVLVQQTKVSVAVIIKSRLLHHSQAVVVAVLVRLVLTVLVALAVTVV
jgi:hypothetical protein